MAKSDLEIWIDQYSDELLRWAEYRLGDHDLAQDLVQETFLAAYEKFDTFKGDSSPKTWLSRILRNKITDYFRSAYYKRNVFEKEQGEDEGESQFFTPKGHWHTEDFEMGWESQDQLMDREDFQVLFKRCMDNLPQTWRDILAAKFFAKESGEAISQEFEISTSNYWQIIHRAKLSLKNCLEVYWKS